MGAGRFAAHEVDGAAVRLHAFGDDGQADAGAADRAALRPPPLIERLEDPIAVVGVHAGAVVADVHDEIVALHSRADVDRAAARRELDRVRQQVLEHELELAFVGEHVDRADRELQLDLLVRQHEPMLAQHAEDHRLQLELRQLERRRVRLPGAERQEVLDELLQLDAVVAQDARHFLLLDVERADGAVEQQLRAFANVRERRLELVRHVAQELVLLVGRFFEPMAQPFELAAERFDVVRSADGDRPAEVAFAELANRAVDLAHRPPDEQQEQADEDERAGDQRRRQPRELLLRRARVLLQRFEPAVDRVAHAVGDGARRFGQHAEALDDRVAGAVRRCRRAARGALPSRPTTSARAARWMFASLGSVRSAAMLLSNAAWSPS